MEGSVEGSKDNDGSDVAAGEGAEDVVGALDVLGVLEGKSDGLEDRVGFKDGSLEGRGLALGPGDG